MKLRPLVTPLTLVLLSVLGATCAQAQPTVHSAELFAGNPNYDEPKDRAKEGQGLRDDPPLAWRTLLFAGDKLVTAVGQEIWFTDLKATPPVLKRLAGVENRTGQSLRPGPGGQARFANISGLALLPDGSLVGADQTGNDIFMVSDPFGPACTVSLIAGTTQAQESVSPGNPPNVGDVDGPGAKARFELPEWPAVVGQDIYFIDEGKCKLKKIAPDAAHTVSTVTQLPKDGIYSALIALNGKLYTLANNSNSEGFIIEIDPTTGAQREVIKGRSDAFEGDGAINVSGLTTDGQGLFTSQSGQLLYVTLDGKVKSLAGTGVYFDFQQPYDPTKPQKADTVQLVTMRRVQTAGSNVFMAYKDKAVYFCATNTTAYIERLQL
ncbi:hypothetical protein IAD21_06380 [Abditibacteriota bacterium]|nr:hypothetical protein IAD21_06380 [Abditibacteriota bacterium]